MALSFLLAGIGGDLVEEVVLIDNFTTPRCTLRKRQSMHSSALYNWLSACRHWW
jgi:hypothetical protein